MSTLFEEAIAEGRQLRQLAEENAKKKILDAMAPRIRRLIEQELVDDLDNDVEGPPQLDSLLTPPVPDLLDDEDTDDHPHIDIDIAGDATIALTSEPVSFGNETDDLVNLNKESARALASLIRGTSKSRKNTITEKVDRLSNHVKKFKRLLEWTNIDKSDPTLRESVRNHYTQLLKEAISLRGQVIFTKRTNENVRSRFNTMIREIETMSRRHTETLFDRLFEKKRGKNEEGHEELDELDVVLDDGDLDTLGVEDVEGVDLSDLEVDVMMADEEPAEDDVGDEPTAAGDDEDFDLGELDLVLGDEDLEALGVEDTEDADVSGLSVDVMMADEDADEEEWDPDAEAGEPSPEDAEMEEMEHVYEIDESVLRRELRRMRRLREQEEAKDADPYLAHGGEDAGDSFIDVDEETLLNALADELGDPSVATPTVESRRRRRRGRQRFAESRTQKTRRRRRRATKINESRKNRVLKKRLVEYNNAVHSLRNQLTEMNLFNAKLLYVNKLMQNRNLSSKQQRAIVEALDNAKTLREAKLLYRSLTNSFNKRKGLTEGRVARTLGSSSRSTRSASPSKNGIEVDRWAVLAGINGKR